ncbi:hypothetical protein ACJIZ3_007727 [Penstemon smallii]|uniref:RING-type E3 ubiquitin transferase n=1 Tax=Penstemon smallii TaxID=265156 RepID=A0ABD3T8N8_9LAMI
MGSVGNSNPWAPYDNYKDCSLGICSIYCPQFCYLIFPPPPPSDDDSATPFSPLIIAIIGVLASAFLLVSYYTIVTRYCKRTNVQTNAETEEIGHDDHQWSQIASSGLDEATIKTITVCKYKKGDGLIEGNDQGGGGKFRRSVSLGAFSGPRAILISDIMKIEGIEEDVEVGIDQSLKGIGSSMGLLRSPVAMKRSVSTGRFMFTVQDKGKNSILPT